MGGSAGWGQTDQQTVLRAATRRPSCQSWSRPVAPRMARPPRFVVALAFFRLRRVLLGSHLLPLQVEPPLVQRAGEAGGHAVVITPGDSRPGGRRHCTRLPPAGT